MATYETFASVYDAIMDDSLYEKWTDFSLRHFPKDKKKLLELACGTGIQSIYFKQAGFDVTWFTWRRRCRLMKRFVSVWIPTAPSCGS